MHLLRLLLTPFSWLYGAGIRVRHALYDAGLVKSSRPTVPTIVIGNLSLGGTGKTPHVELVLRTLNDLAPLATLSRGYGRRGSELREVDATDDAALSGDEPLMLKRKFPRVRVFVGGDRLRAIERIREEVPGLKAVILDDAFQHRRLNAGLNILLTTWDRPYFKDHVLPAGRLRDLPSRSRAADAVIVTKCPALPSVDDQGTWRRQLRLRDDQPLFFSGLRYEEPRSVIDPARTAPSGSHVSALLFTGIADASPLLAHVRSLYGRVDHLAFPDHHRFTIADLTRLAGLFSSFAPGEKTLITTAKDVARLGAAIMQQPLQGLPLAVIDVKTELLTDPEPFNEFIRRHIATDPAHG